MQDNKNDVMHNVRQEQKNVIPSIADIFGLEFIFYLIKNIKAALVNTFLFTVGQNIVFFMRNVLPLVTKPPKNYQPR